jgi:hypothetical protein
MILIYNAFYLNGGTCRHATKNPTDQHDQSPRHFQRPWAAWLRPHQPIAKIGYSIFIYDLSGNSEGLMELEQTCAVSQDCHPR